MRTLEEIKKCGKPFLIPADVAPFLRCDPYSINVAARQNPAALGFPVILMGSRVRIPRDRAYAQSTTLLPVERSAIQRNQFRTDGL